MLGTIVRTRKTQKEVGMSNERKPLCAAQNIMPPALPEDTYIEQSEVISP
jgi:hypothetical protein